MTRYFVVIVAFLYAFAASVRAEQFLGMGSHYAASVTIDRTSISPVEGIVHRYPDRVLLKPLHACAVYCRFCFRREMVGPKGLGALSADAVAK